MTAPRIAEPCHEPWTAMTPNREGRHCATCDKTVVDVSAMAPRAARAYLDRELPARLARGERVCVRAQADGSGRLLRPGVTRRMLTNGLALMLAAAGGLAALGAAEEEPRPPMMGKIAAPVAEPVVEPICEPMMGSVAPPSDPLAPVSDAASGLTVRIDAEAKLLIASDAAGAERWRTDLAAAGVRERPTGLALDGRRAVVTCGGLEVSVDIRTGAVYDR
jgi:hypothetical protein